jgi:hypothetical protein
MTIGGLIASAATEQQSNKTADEELHPSILPYGFVSAASEARTYSLPELLSRTWK